jgi:hypothetical protein
MEIRMTKTNTEAKNHAEARHPQCTFATCWPGQFDPTIQVSSASAETSSASTNGTASAAPKKTKKAAATDLSFLDEALKPVNIQRKK